MNNDLHNFTPTRPKTLRLLSSFWCGILAERMQKLEARSLESPAPREVDGSELRTPIAMGESGSRSLIC